MGSLCASGQPIAATAVDTEARHLPSDVNLPVLSELQRIVSFFLPKGPCLIHTEIVKGSFGLTETTPSGILTAWVPLNSKTWSLSWPLSVGRPTVQFKELLGEGSSSAVPDAAPRTRDDTQCTFREALKRHSLPATRMYGPVSRLYQVLVPVDFFPKIRVFVTKKIHK